MVTFETGLTETGGKNWNLLVVNGERERVKEWEVKGEGMRENVCECVRERERERERENVRECRMVKVREI